MSAPTPSGVRVGVQRPYLFSSRTARAAPPHSARYGCVLVSPLQHSLGLPGQVARDRPRRFPSGYAGVCSRISQAVLCPRDIQCGGPQSNRHPYRFSLYTSGVDAVYQHREASPRLSHSSGCRQRLVRASRIATPAPPSPIFSLVGNVKPHKNIRGLIDAFTQLAPDSSYDLIIVGQREGFITADTQVAAQAQALGDRVIFTGWLTDSQVKQYVAHAGALVLPSFYEGFGLPPLEAMGLRNARHRLRRRFVA